MAAELKVNVGQFSSPGPKEVNDDACGIQIPEDPRIGTKGMAAVIADGMGNSEAGREAAQACVTGFLSDYFSTPESWSVKKSAGTVLSALNRWLYGQGRKMYGSSRALVTTLSVLVIKSTTAHLFHVGDTRIYRLRGKDLECLTRDHRVLILSDRHCLARAMGIDPDLSVDCRSVPVEEGDLFLLTTDGVHDHLGREELRAILSEEPHPEQAVRRIVERARDNGSTDNLTCQLVRVEQLPVQDRDDLYGQLTELPFPPPLQGGMILDGYRILRELHASNRVQIYLALDLEAGREVVLKTPSVNFEDRPEYIEQFLHEEWVGHRVDSPHVLKVLPRSRKRSCLYYVTEYVQGQTLRQWMRDHPRPSLPQVRAVVEQIAAGLYAFHRLEMYHQDLKPENIMIDAHDTVKIIDFGSTKIAGIEEISVPWERSPVLGTRHYTAPESLQGYAGTERADLFSLGVICYEMLTGRLPYGESVASGPHSRAVYTPAVRIDPEIPAWVDGALKKAVQIHPRYRYEAISEFVYNLSHPDPTLLSQEPLPLLERDPVAFWRILAILFFFVSLLLLYFLAT